jgi:hypothetical protein
LVDQDARKCLGFGRQTGASIRNEDRMRMARSGR